MDVRSQRAAAEAFSRLCDEAENVRVLYDAAGMAMPPAVAAFLDIPADNGRSGRQPRISLPPPDPPPRPAEARSEWIWIPVKDVNAVRIVLGILRDSSTPLSLSAIADIVSKHQPDINPRSVLNIGPREDGKLLTRTDAGKWAIRERDKAPVLWEGFAWGPPEIFDKYELAAHRRIMILHLLQAMPSGLQTVQIMEHLRQLPYCRAPVSKEHVQVDMEVLHQQAKVRRIGNTKKWTIVESQTE
jgi:hypothetical protein